MARNVSVDKSTVYRISNLFCMTGSVKKKPYPKEKSYRKITPPVQLLILHLLIEKPGISLKEIQQEVLETLLVDVCESAIFRFLQISGFTYQKLRIVATQQDQFCRQVFISDMSVYNRDMLIFIDETGADRRNCIRKYGYSMRGKPLKTHRLLVRGERVSAIACISTAGLLDVMTVKGTTDGNVLFFCSNSLNPTSYALQWE